MMIRKLYITKVYSMSTKKRLNLLIDPKEAERLPKLAEQQEVSVSWLVRRAIRLLLDSWPQPQPRGKDPLLEVLGSFSAESLSSRQIDELLYALQPQRKTSPPSLLHDGLRSG